MKKPPEEDVRHLTGCGVIAPRDLTGQGDISHLGPFISQREHLIAVSNYNFVFPVFSPLPPLVQLCLFLSYIILMFWSN